MTNQMRSIRIEKLTLNIGSGKDQNVLEKGVKLIKHLTGSDPVKTKTSKRIPGWGLRPGLPIGCKITIRDPKRAQELIQTFLKAKKDTLKPTNFDENGSVAFGIHEYIDIPGIKYEPEVGIMGFEVCVTLERPGFRIKRRRLEKRPVPKRHKIAKDEAIQFMKDTFKVEVGDSA